MAKKKTTKKKKPTEAVVALEVITKIGKDKIEVQGTFIWKAPPPSTGSTFTLTKNSLIKGEKSVGGPRQLEDKTFLVNYVLPNRGNPKKEGIIAVVNATEVTEEPAT